jgi:hypothetical protein
MAVTGVSNLAELISNQSPGQGQSAPGGALPIQSLGAGKPGPTQDSFTPSSQNNSAPVTAQDAGLFQASQFALGAATAELLTTQTAAPQTPHEIAPAQAIQTGTADVAIVQAASTLTQNVQTLAAPAAPATAMATPIPAAAPVATTAIAPGELQSMNAELLGLGLNNNDIQIIDRVATVARNFDPLVYNDLIQQFEAQVAQQAAPAAAGNKPAAQIKIAGA